MYVESVSVPPGFNAESLPVYAKRSQRMVITARKMTLTSSRLVPEEPLDEQPVTVSVLCCCSAPVTNAPVTPKALTAGHKRSHPAYIPSHLPEFPDPHTYIKTPVSQNGFSFSRQKENPKKTEFSLLCFLLQQYDMKWCVLTDVQRTCV